MRNFIIYLACAAVFLALQMFQGFSYLDIGMYLSGSEWLSDTPLTMYFLCNWLMSFRVNTFLMNMFSADSFFALRIIHLIYILCLQTAIFLYCRRYISERMILLGLALATLSHYGAYTEMNYNDYTVGLLTAAVMMYHMAVERKSNMFFAASGLVVAVSFFFRIVNLSFILLPLWYGAYALYAKSAGIRQIAGQCLWFATGVIVGLALMLCLVYADGMWQPFSLLLGDILGVCGNSSDPHSLYNITVAFFFLHRGEVESLSVVILLFLAMSWINTRYASRMKWLVIVGLGLVMAYNLNFAVPPSDYTVGLCIVALLLVLTVSCAPEAVKRLYVLSFFIPFLMPLGSNAGAEFFGKDLCFFTLPIALYVINIWTIGHKGCRVPAMICYAAMCLGFLYVNVMRPMMEETNRIGCRYAIDSPKAEHIYTGRDNAELHNKLIRELKPLVEDGSYMYCDFSLAAVPLLDCKPYAVFSTVFTSDAMNRRYIDVAFDNTDKLPLMLLTKDNDDPKVEYVVEYLKQKSPYTVSWQDDTHILLTPIKYPCR